MSKNVEIISKLFSKRKTGLTAPEVSERLNLNIKTARNILAKHFAKVGEKKCSVSGIKRSCYHLVS